MVKIRLRRMGAKKQPTYRFVVADSKAPRDGAFIEILGHYNPRTEPKTLEVNAEKAKEWLGKGAQPTETVRRLFAGVNSSEGPPSASSKSPETAITESRNSSASSLRRLKRQ